MDTSRIKYVGDETVSYHIALCYMKMKDNEKALKYIDMSIKEESATGRGMANIPYQYHFHKARILSKLKRYEEAVEKYDNALTVWGNGSESFYYKSLDFLAMGDSVRSCELMRKSLELANGRYKSADGYVEFFEEVYPLQIEESLNVNCK